MKTVFILFSAICVASSAAAADLNLNQLCDGILFATLPHPDDENLFIGCVQGRGTVLGCGDADDRFDPIEVSCVNRYLTTTRSPSEQVCDDNGIGSFPVEGDCTSYIICDSTGPSIRQCPENSVFNPILPGCVFGNTSTCEIFEPTTEAPTTTPTVSPSTAPTVTPPPGGSILSFVCPIEGFGNIPHQTDCSRFFECIQGIRFARNCEAGLIFDIISKECGEPEHSLCAVNIRCY